MAENSRLSRLHAFVWLFCLYFACTTASKLQRRTPADDDKNIIVKKVSGIQISYLLYFREFPFLVVVPM